MKKVGFFQNSKDKALILKKVKSSLKNCQKNWKAIPGTISQFEYCGDGQTQPTIVIKNNGVFLRIITEDTEFIYGMW
jgi:hypothetical protein